MGFSKIQAELANLAILPNFAAKLSKLGKFANLPNSVKIKNPLNISKFNFLNFVSIYVQNTLSSLM